MRWSYMSIHYLKWQDLETDTVNLELFEKLNQEFDTFFSAS